MLLAKLHCDLWLHQFFLVVAMEFFFSNTVTVINAQTICINMLVLRLLTAFESIINCNEVCK